MRRGSFQFGFKRWQGWAVSRVLWEWIPNVGSKAREGAKAMSLALALLDFQHAGFRRRAYSYETCRHAAVQSETVSMTRTTYSTETHTSDFILNTFWNGKPVQFFQEWWWRGAKRTSLAAKFWIFWRGWMTELGRCTHDWGDSCSSQAVREYRK